MYKQSFTEVVDMKATELRWVREASYGDYEFTIYPPDVEPIDIEDDKWDKWEWWVAYAPRFSMITARGYASSEQEALDAIQEWCEENIADY